MTKLLCGLDEAGRGPLAGPVVAGAVILSENFPTEILNDSKKLSEKKRLLAETIIKEKSLWGIGIVSEKIIDEINILQASLCAMKNAFQNMMKMLAEKKIENVSLSAIADGKFVPKISCECRAVVKADATFPCVMAASILAKTCRDKIMLEYDKQFPAYGYAKHKGYPTLEHRAICKALGPSPIQRLTFRY